jgi:hypothetical protein
MIIRSIGFVVVALIVVTATGCKKDVAEKTEDKVEAVADAHAGHDHE